MMRMGATLVGVIMLGCAPEALVLEGADADQEASVIDALGEFEAASGRVLTPLEIVFDDDEDRLEGFAGRYSSDGGPPLIVLDPNLEPRALSAVARHELSHHLDALSGWESLSTDQLDGVLLRENSKETLAELGELGPSDLARAVALASACEAEALARAATWGAGYLFPEAPEPTLRVSEEAGRRVRVVAVGQRFASATVRVDGSVSLVQYADGQVQARGYSLETGQPLADRSLSQAWEAQVCGPPTQPRLSPQGEPSRMLAETEVEIGVGRRVQRVSTLIGGGRHLVRLTGVRLVEGQDETYVAGVGCGPEPAEVCVLDDGRVVVLELSETEASWWIVGP